MATNIYSIEDGALRLHFHAGQARAWQSEKRNILVLAGTQSGKTSFMPWWLWKQIRKFGAGDYLAVTATFDLFKLKFLPLMRECFEHVLGIGRYWSGDRVIELADPETGKFRANRADDPMWGRIILRSAESKGGLESSTALAAVLDEAGMDSFTQETVDAVTSRLSLSRGPALFGTTLYTLRGWLRKLFDRARAGDPDIDLIQFDSTANPSFSREEFEERRRTMPRWKFNMRYRGRYERPAGLIYDSFDPKMCIMPRFPIPVEWPRVGGLDFGGVNTAAILYAQEPGTPRLIAYKEYHAGGRRADQHATEILKGEPMIPTMVGGSKSEDQWRDEFSAGGLPVMAPLITDVEVGINRVYGAHSRNEVIIFDDLTGYLEQLETYTRKLDANQEPTEEIEDKNTFHFMDAARYIIGWLRDDITIERAGPQLSQALRGR